MSLLHTILAFVVAIGVLVTVHEFGHYWVARRLGVKVQRFSIGFGPPLWSRRAGPDDTEYVIAAIPLGGYVKMLDETEGAVAPEERHRAFNRQTLAVRSAVVVAGPLANFLFAVLAYWMMFILGVSGLRPIVGEVEPGSIAANAGLVSGHEITGVEDTPTKSWASVVQAFVGSSLDHGAVAMELASEDGRVKHVSVALHGVVLDDLTRGQFFQTLGFEPSRPSIPAVIGEIVPASPAARAGLAPGDRIVAADDVSIPDWRAWVAFVRARPDKTIRTRVLRDGVHTVISLRPEAVDGEAGVIGRIGAIVRQPEGRLDRFYVTERYPPGAAFSKALAKTRDVTLLTLRMLWKMILLEVSVENLSGPISIAQYAGFSAQIGLARFLEFLGIVSISLGILNLLPIPILDGGHLMYYFAELLRGRPVPDEIQFFGQRLGIAMLVGLMGVAFYNDLVRLFG